MTWPVEVPVAAMVWQPPRSRTSSLCIRSDDYEAERRRTLEFVEECYGQPAREAIEASVRTKFERNPDLKVEPGHGCPVTEAWATLSQGRRKLFFGELVDPLRSAA